MTRHERDKLIEDYETVRARWLKAVKDGSLKSGDLDALKREFRRLMSLYFDGLPRTALSRCPHTGTPLTRVFDPWGVDGYWWQEGELAKHEEASAPPTFAVLTGALDLRDKPPRGGPREEAHVGPAVPFVIPRLLKMPGMIAVVSCVDLENGYRAYPVAYFSSERILPGTLTSTWCRTSYDWRDAAGNPSYTFPVDLWDFDLAPWIAQGKVRWIAPNDRSLKLLGKDDGHCPYVDLPGRRERQIIKGDAMRTEPPPSGERVDPFNE